MCDAIEQLAIDYNCERRPWMTITLVISILLFIIIRKQVPQKKKEKKRAVLIF